MLNVLYKNCPKKPAESSRRVNNLDTKKTSDNDVDDDAWKKDYTKWVPAKHFKKLPEKEQAAHKKAQQAAKEKRKQAKVATAKVSILIAMELVLLLPLMTLTRISKRFQKS